MNTELDKNRVTDVFKREHYLKSEMLFKKGMLSMELEYYHVIRGAYDKFPDFFCMGI